MTLPGSCGKRLHDVYFGLALWSFELGDGELLAVFQRRLMGDDSGDGHCQRFVEVYFRLAVFEQCVDKFSGYEDVGAAVSG